VKDRGEEGRVLTGAPFFIFQFVRGVSESISCGVKIKAQRLKPGAFGPNCGTTEVVPCYESKPIAQRESKAWGTPGWKLQL